MELCDPSDPSDPCECSSSPIYSLEESSAGPSLAIEPTILLERPDSFLFRWDATGGELIVLDPAPSKARTTEDRAGGVWNSVTQILRELKIVDPNGRRWYGFVA